MPKFISVCWYTLKAAAVLAYVFFFLAVAYTWHNMKLVWMGEKE